MAKTSPAPEPEYPRFRIGPPDVNSVELGRPDGTLLRIEAGQVHEERDQRVVSDLEQHWALERV